ncbi:MAG: hypothetical protein WC229_01425 [Candidatus Paceibacterota bacterium]|jgi:hypothetical protein
MKKILSITVILGTIIIANQASAHNPRLVWDIKNTSISPIIIEKPEISQAYYGILKNKPEYYKIKIDQPSIIYFGLLVPDNGNASVGLSAKMIKLSSPDSDIKMYLDGNKTNWESYYEEFAGDFYLKGPEETKYVKTGEYLIEITSEDNVGKYVLTVGQEESFPLNEAMKTIMSLPKLKINFFEEPAYMLASGILGKTISALFLFLLLLVLMSMRKIKEKK